MRYNHAYQNYFLYEKCRDEVNAAFFERWYKMINRPFSFPHFTDSPFDDLYPVE